MITRQVRLAVPGTAIPPSLPRHQLSQISSKIFPSSSPFTCLRFFLFLLTVFYISSFFHFPIQLCSSWWIFIAPFFTFSRLIGFIHISLCCDSVSFDFIKPATIVARFIPHSCLLIFQICSLSESIVTGNASRARAVLGLVLKTRLDTNIIYVNSN